MAEILNALCELMLRNFISCTAYLLVHKNECALEFCVCNFVLVRMIQWSLIFIQFLNRKIATTLI